MRFQLGISKWTAVVIEDRGNLGHGGGRVLRLQPEGPYASSFELDEDVVTLIDEDRSLRTNTRHARTTAK